MLCLKAKYWNGKCVEIPEGDLILKKFGLVFDKILQNYFMSGGSLLCGAV